MTKLYNMETLFLWRCSRMFRSVGFMLFPFPHNGRLDKVPIKPFVSLYKPLKAIHIFDARQNFCSLCLYAGRSGVCQDYQWPESSNGRWHSELQQLSDQVMTKTAEQCSSHLILPTCGALFSVFIVGWLSYRRYICHQMKVGFRKPFFFFLSPQNALRDSKNALLLTLSAQSNSTYSSYTGYCPCQDQVVCSTELVFIKSGQYARLQTFVVQLSVITQTSTCFNCGGTLML